MKCDWHTIKTGLKRVFQRRNNVDQDTSDLKLRLDGIEAYLVVHRELLISLQKSLKQLDNKLDAIEKQPRQLVIQSPPSTPWVPAIPDPNPIPPWRTPNPYVPTPNPGIIGPVWARPEIMDRKWEINSETSYIPENTNITINLPKTSKKDEKTQQKG